MKTLKRRIETSGYGVDLQPVKYGISKGIDNKDRNNGQCTYLPLSNGSDTDVWLRVGEDFANGSTPDGAQLISTRPRRATAKLWKVDRGSGSRRTKKSRTEETGFGDRG